MIFLVDDDDAIRDAIQLLLECESYAVRAFPSCDALTAAVDPVEAQCLILDHQMKGTTGLQLCERLHGRRPVILMTGQPSPELRARAAAAGAFAFLEKPFHGNELLEIVSRALDASP